MNVDVGIWEKLTRLVIGLIALAAVAAVVVWYLPLIHQNEQMRRQIQQLQNEVRLEEEKARELHSQIESLRNDPRTLERQARETLRVGRSNETIIIFEPPATNSSPAGPAPR